VTGLGRRVVAAVAGVMLAAAIAPAPLTARAAGGLEGVPSYQHVFVLIEENESFSSTFGPSSAAHYLNNTLVPAGVLDDHYYATGHVSLDNYIAMTSAQPANPETTSDCLSVSLYTCAQTTLAFSSGANIADQLETAGATWKGYMDSMPSPCFSQTYSPSTATPDPYQGNSQTPPAKDYADRHNPFIYYPDIVGNTTRCQAHVVPYTQLATDIAGNAVPNYAFITPDTCHDGHDTPTCSDGSAGGLVSADAWLSANVPPILSYIKAHDGLLLITFDEGSNTDVSGCCTGGPGGTQGRGGLVGLVALGPGVKTGQTVHTSYDHASLLRTLEDIFGINTYLNDAGATGAVPMTALFGGPGTGIPDSPLAVTLPLAGTALVLVGFIRRRRRAP